MYAPSRSTIASPKRSGLLGRLHHIGLWAARVVAYSRQRRDLARLDDHLLRDIGVTREQIDADLEKPIWDVPSHWKQ